MVRPANFGFNTETAENNAFQINDTSLTIAQIKDAALKEFDFFVKKIRQNSIDVIVIEDSDEPVKTDAVFPNNWFSTHANGDIFIYPMYSPNRRLEKRKDIIDALSERFIVNKYFDLSGYEAKNQFLEGTGSMIIDRPNGIIYACISERSNQYILEKFARQMDYKLIAFIAKDSDGLAYYHTNVIMALGEDIAIICLESIVEIDERKKVEESLKDCGKIIIDITRDQVVKFAGNMLQVNNKNGSKFLIMSSSAFRSLTPSQKDEISEYCEIIHADLSTIEKYGGGSARCMMAEIFLSQKNEI